MPEPTVETYLFRIQTDPNASASPVSTAYFGEATTVNGIVFRNDLAQTVTWPLQSDQTVTVSGTTLTYTQVSAFVTAIAYQEKAAQAAPGEP